MSGLEILKTTNFLRIKQETSIVEVAINFERNNKYNVFNSANEQIYKAVEDTDCCTRNCCGPGRPFDMILTDSKGSPVIQLHRPLACCCICCFPCCPQNIEISCPIGNFIGKVVEEWSILHPRFALKNANDDTILTIKGPFICSCRCCSDQEFEIFSADGETKVGNIVKHWGGCCKESFTVSDNYSINFPKDIDVTSKAIVMAATFLIDFMFFEYSGNN